MMPSAIQLYLIRHGLAEERGHAYPDDTQRPLTSRGAARLRKERRALDRLGVAFDQVLTSPLVRTRQTAELIAGGPGARPPIALVAALAPEGTPAAVIEELGKYARRSRIALVGHEPNMGELAARLIGARAAVPFRKGAVCRIDFEALPPARAGRLQWFLTPKMLRTLAK